MIKISFTPNLSRHIATPEAELNGDTVASVLAEYFEHNPQVQTYLLDDQGALREHVLIFVVQELIKDRNGMSDKLGQDSEIFVVQALSGG